MGVLLFFSARFSCLRLRSSCAGLHRGLWCGRFPVHGRVPRPLPGAGPGEGGGCGEPGGRLAALASILPVVSPPSSPELRGRAVGLHPGQAPQLLTALQPRLLCGCV